MRRLLSWGIFVLIIPQFSCSDDGENISPPEHQYLVSATSTGSFSLQTFQVYTALLGLDQLTNLLQHDVQAYTIIYKTTYKGSPIEASGVIYIPQGLTSPAPLLSLHHGTTLDKSQAPSETDEFSGFEFFGSAGYITLVPDFIGYGASDDIFPPYYNQEHAALAVTDMIKAATEFLLEEEILYNEKLFLAGYSEGGFVTLAAARDLEDNPIQGLTVTAVAAGAGGYDLENMVHEILSKDEYVYPSYLAFLVSAYNETNDWNTDLDQFFREPYATNVETYLNGQYGGEFINSKLTTDLKSLLTEDFYGELTDPESESDFVQALEENGIAGWNTTLPIRLYHGTADEIIPYENSETTLQNFEDFGSEHVSLTLFPLTNHVQTLTPTLVEVMLWFDELK
jgi:pimeloyl-ACP methyl ester carboxylesterase